MISKPALNMKSIQIEENEIMQPNFIEEVEWDESRVTATGNEGATVERW